MKIQPLSDLHVEFMRDSLYKLDIPVTDADVIVLAGDIGVGFGEESEFCKRLAQEHQKPVVFVLGNHSFYKGNFDIIRQQWYAADLSKDGVQFLDTGITYLNGDVTFVGGTFWTDFNDYDDTSMNLSMHHMNDFRICKMDENDSLKSGRKHNHKDYFKLTPVRTVDEHVKTLDWITKVNSEISGKTVVVSHHSPSYMSVSPKFAGDPMNPAFVSDLDSWVESQHFALWVHGHNHNSSDYMIGDTRVVCNPYGYHMREENSEFINDLVIEV